VKRSEINDIMRAGVRFLEQMNFFLPRFAFWSPEEWQHKGMESKGIVDSQLGWDITDFGSGAFDQVGLFLFTIRNGNLHELTKQNGKNYAEKVLIVLQGQVTPTHFWNATSSDELADNDVCVSVDGVTQTTPAGGMVVLHPGESVSLPPRLYHSFWGQGTGGTVLVGEVSRVNDDRVDNHFFKPTGRFPSIEEDVPPLYLLGSDYPAYYRFCAQTAADQGPERAQVRDGGL
jgi:D-lyxose ketol-isomerase